MAKADVSTTIKRPVEDVFAVLSNPENSPKWSSASLEAKITSTGPIGVGSTARTVSKFLGKRLESEMELTEYEPNRKFAGQSKSGPFPFQISMTFEGTEGGTRVNANMEAEPSGFFKLAEPLIVRTAKRQLQSDLDNLKDLMEANAL
ncbi:MAG: SRPBCC family protein [Chloroflexota bacterium]|nr:SRPBCC family protein [Chloroflexota bacterium]